VNEKSQVTKERLPSKERKSIRNHEKGGRTAEKHGEIEAIEKSNNSSMPCAWLLRKLGS
jgi:hypothetical protein